MTSAVPPIRLLGVALAAVLVLSACGSDDPSVDTIGASEESQVAAVSEDALPGVNLAAFFEGALTEDAVTNDCTLSDGTETSCYQLTVAGFPATRDEIGPWCPSTTSDIADDVGIWFDGDAVYDLDGEFIMDLAEIYGDSNWQLYDENGNVFSTDSAERFREVAGPPDIGGEVADENQNLCVYGEVEWVEGGGPIAATVEIPVTPVMADEPTEAGLTLGVTLDGVLIENSAPVAFILANYTVAAFDDCGGHVNPIEGYHMHATTGCSDSDVDVPDGETAMFGYALDGFAIHAPFEESVEADAGLDQCNGHDTEELGYHYHANQVEDNAVLTCFSGQTTQAESGDLGGGPPGGARDGAGPPPGG